MHDIAQKYKYVSYRGSLPKCTISLPWTAYSKPILYGEINQNPYIPMNFLILLKLLTLMKDIQTFPTCHKFHRPILV